MSRDFNDSTPILVVRDVEKSVAYYRDALGFSVDFSFGEPPSYAGVYRGAVLLHLQADLRGLDFSGRTVWQAYLQGMSLPDVDFSRAQGPSVNSHVVDAAVKDQARPGVGPDPGGHRRCTHQ